VERRFAVVDDKAESPEEASASLSDAPHRAVIAGVVPGQSPRVVIEAARFAQAFSAPLAIVHVDVTRFVTFEDPDGYVHTASVNAATAAAAADLSEIQDAAASALADIDVAWSVHQLVGDPALAMAHLAERTDARMYVIGTRKRGFSESVREFFTGSVAARLSHRQQRPVVVVPLGVPVALTEDFTWE
jgi:nucleotide-binding universal stress UspA family protein